MKRHIRIFICLAALLVAAASLAACSQKNGAQNADRAAGGLPGSGNSRNGETSEGGRDSSRKEITGRVKSVTGNQVELEIGTVSGKASGKEKDGASSSSAVSAQSAGASSGSSGGTFTATGETKTILIPVGLTLTYGNARADSGGKPGGGEGVRGGNEKASEETASRASGSGSFRQGGGTPPSGGTQGGGGFGGGTAKSSSSSRSGTGALTAGNTKRSKDFSSIQAGMVLTVVETDGEDGTEQIVQVRVVSE